MNVPTRMTVSRRPLEMTPSPDGPSNKHDGLYVGPDDGRGDVNVKAIPPNGERPIENSPKTRHLFGTFSD